MAYNLGNNLIEIASLTTLVGAATAESLILASQGAGGLPWAAMSCFGSLFLAKACIAAALPSWLRESAGVNSSLSASILGVSHPLDKNSMLKVGPGNPAGISVSLHSKPSIDSIHAFDKYTLGIVQSRLSFQDDNSQHVFAFTEDGSNGVDAHDWIAILLSLVKLVETIVLWTQGAWQLSVACAGSWAFFFIAALFLQDIISGDFPTMDAADKKLNVILGVPVNVRTHPAWRFVWTVGGLVCLTCTVASYMLLRSVTTKQFYIWASFQCLWLICRTAFHHVAVVTDGRRHPIVEVDASRYRSRLLSICSGVSRHLAQQHPRTPESYVQDVHDMSDFRPYIKEGKSQLDWELPLNDGDSAAYRIGEFVDAEILAVVGDTMLSSLSWIYEYGMINLELYDSCLVSLKVNDQTFIVPSCRVLSGNVTKAKAQLLDAEAGIAPTFIPISGPCRGPDNGWVYWIPIGSDRWLYIIPGGLSFLGRQRAEVLTSEEVTRRLMLGTLWVSIRSVEEVKDVVEKGAMIARGLFSCLELGEEFTQEEEEFDSRK